MPINIIELAKKQGFRVFKKTTAQNELGFISKYLIRKQTENDNEIKTNVIIVNTDDALKIRLHVAYHFAAYWLKQKDYINESEFIESSTVKDGINCDSKIYILAINLLMPKDKLLNYLRDEKKTIKQILSKQDYEGIINEFYVPTVDIENMLKYLDGDC